MGSGKDRGHGLEDFQREKPTVSRSPQVPYKGRWDGKRQRAWHGQRCSSMSEASLECVNPHMCVFQSYHAQASKCSHPYNRSLNSIFPLVPWGSPIWCLACVCGGSQPPNQAGTDTFSILEAHSNEASGPRSPRAGM